MSVYFAYASIPTAAAQSFDDPCLVFIASANTKHATQLCHAFEPNEITLVSHASRMNHDVQVAMRDLSTHFSVLGTDSSLNAMFECVESSDAAIDRDVVVVPTTKAGVEWISLYLESRRTLGLPTNIRGVIAPANFAPEDQSSSDDDSSSDSDYTESSDSGCE